MTIQGGIKSEYEGELSPVPVPGGRRAEGRTQRSVLLICMVMVTVTFALFWQTGNNEFLNYDDADYIWENAHIVKGLTSTNIAWAFTAVDANNWHPLTWLSHMADVQLYGLDPRGHHLTNVAIHAGATVALFLLLFRLTGELWKSSVVAALFCLHPLHVQSVAWAAERKDVLSALFWSLTLLLYAKYAATLRVRHYCYALLCFMLGLMAKQMLVTLPLIMLLLDFWPLRRFSFQSDPDGQQPSAIISFSFLRLIVEKIPFFACSVTTSLITIYAQNSGGAIHSFETLSLGYRIQNAFTAYVTYILKTIWPRNLAVFYPAPDSIPLWQVACSLALLFCVTLIALKAWRRHPYLAVGWFWFLISLMPVIGIIQVGSQAIADRYSYIPLTGLFIIGTWGVSSLVPQQWQQYRYLLLTSSACLVIGISAMVTHRQISYWHDDVSLFRHAIEVSPDNCIARNNLGFSLARKGDPAAAIREYEHALAINPRYVDAYNNLGRAHADLGNYKAAIAAYTTALTIDPRNFAILLNYGNALAKTGDFDGAIRLFREARARDRRSCLALTNLGNALAQSGNLSEAITMYEEALAINPEYLSARKNMATALRMQRRP